MILEVAQKFEIVVNMLIDSWQEKFLENDFSSFQEWLEEERRENYNNLLSLNFPMQLYNHPEFDQHEHVSFFSCSKTGLKAIIAIHNTHLGPALGGCRMWKYATEEQALYDVLRLSKAMTYKAALAGIPSGGGKSVILGDPKADKTAEMMKSMGRAVENLGGRYIIAEDVGTSVEDMNYIHQTTQHVTGVFQNNEGSGDPSPTTAYGVFLGLKSAVKHRLQKESLHGVTISVQGLGHVGYHLCKLLHAAGAKLYVCDLEEEKVLRAVDQFGAIALPLDEIYDLKADVFAPCALGSILNEATIQRLRVSIVAGAANNQLEKLEDGVLLSERYILYAPDYVINAAGLIRVYYEYASSRENPFSEKKVIEHLEKIPQKLEMIFSYANKHGLSTSAAADALAEEVFKGDSASLR